MAKIFNGSKLIINDKSINITNMHSFLEIKNFFFIIRITTSNKIKRIILIAPGLLIAQNDPDKYKNEIMHK